MHMAFLEYRMRTRLVERMRGKKMRVGTHPFYVEPEVNRVSFRHFFYVKTGSKLGIKTGEKSCMISLKKRRKHGIYFEECLGGVGCFSCIFARVGGTRVEWVERVEQVEQVERLERVGQVYKTYDCDV